MIYSSAAGGSTLQIGNLDSHRTIIKGTLEVNGISVLDSLRGLETALKALLPLLPFLLSHHRHQIMSIIVVVDWAHMVLLKRQLLLCKDHSETLSFHAGASYLLGGGEAYGVDEFSDFAFKAGFTYKFGKKSKSICGNSEHKCGRFGSLLKS